MNEDTQEDFEWLLREIQEGGEKRFSAKRAISASPDSLPQSRGVSAFTRRYWSTQCPASKHQMPRSQRPPKPIRPTSHSTALPTARLGRIAILWRGAEAARRSPPPQTHPFQAAFAAVAPVAVDSRPRVYTR